MTRPLRFAALGIDHSHIFGMAQNMIDAGADFVGWWTEGTPDTLDSFVGRFPEVPRVASKEDIFADDGIDLILIAAIPADRAALSIAAMQAGKDVMSDKPGCVTLDQLAALRAAQAETGRIWSVDFSERFEVPAVTRTAELVAAGAIGRVVQTLGIGPHRLNRAIRPEWFFRREACGGILTDIGSHHGTAISTRPSSPSAPSASRADSLCTEARIRCCSTMPSGTPARSQVSTKAVAAAAVRSRGFSIRIGLPAAARIATASARASGGVARMTKSTSGSAAISAALT